MEATGALIYLEEVSQVLLCA
eukprot:COSAG05_NODE_22060_length_267_cov_0.898810_1_plen_20_part_10